MGMFLNSYVPYEGYREALRDMYFVDKSLLLDELIPSFEKRNRYFCITRPRRFGKTVMANMVGAFFGKTDNKDRIFDHLAISGEKTYEAHLNRHDVVYIDFSRAPKGGKSYTQYIDRIENGMLEDLIAAYSDCGISKKDSSGSELNMFVEYDMVTSEKFSEYFGFSDVEVDSLYEIYQKETAVPKFSREDLRIWYDGYYTATGVRLYNPRSVVLSLTDNQLRNYWTSSGPYDELFYYIRNNIEDVRDDLVLMVSGERVAADIGQFAAVSMEISSREQIYSAMVVYGLLTYADGEILIPNKELMDKFNELLLSKDSLGYVYNLARKSEQMLQATIAGDTGMIEEILQFAHDTEAPILSYNNEVELSAVVNLCYLSARNKYRVEREDRAGKGFVDFIFYPEKKSGDCIILELKVDSTPEEAIAQIKEKNYALRFKGKLGEKSKYTGRILAVGISYSKETKEHRCKIEVLSS